MLVLRHADPTSLACWLVFSTSRKLAEKFSDWLEEVAEAAGRSIESTARTSQACGRRFRLARVQASPDPKDSPEWFARRVRVSETSDRSRQGASTTELSGTTGKLAGSFESPRRGTWFRSFGWSFSAVPEVRVGWRFSLVGLCYDVRRPTAVPNPAPPSFLARPTPCLPTGWRAHGHANSKSHA